MMKRRSGSSSPTECSPRTKTPSCAIRSSAARHGGVDRPHAVRNHIQSAPAHAAPKQLAHLRVGLLRVHPVVVRAGIFLRARADVSEMLHARHVARRRTIQMTAGKVFGVERL